MQGTDFLPNILNVWTNDVTNFLKVIGIMSICHFRFLIFVFNCEWQCSQYLELNPTCVECAVDVCGNVVSILD